MKKQKSFFESLKTKETTAKNLGQSQDQDEKEDEPYDENIFPIARGIDHIFFSEFGSERDSQELYLVHNRNFKKIELNDQFTQNFLYNQEDTKETYSIFEIGNKISQDQEKSVIEINGKNKKFPIFKKDAGFSTKILEIKPFDHDDKKFILMVSNSNESYFFSFLDRTVRNHACVYHE